MGKGIAMNNILKPNGNAKHIHKINTVKVLNVIRNCNRISRADVARTTGLSAPTVSRIVEDLIDADLVQETGEGDSQGGRRPTLLQFAGALNRIIGIDLGTTNIYGVLCDLNAKILVEKSRPTCVAKGFRSIIRRTSELIEELEASSGPRSRPVLGVGLAVAGLIDRERNVVEFSPDFHWENVDVQRELARRHSIPIVFDNVTRVMALGEICFGVGKRFRNFVCVNVGYGIGGGIVIDGEPVFGPRGIAGEIGHMTLDRNSGRLCDCGNFGCLEALASGNAIAKEARARLQAGEDSVLRTMCGDAIDGVTAEMVANAAKKGDPMALDIFHRAAEYLGIGIAALINLLDPEAVVIGGGVAQAGDLLFDIVRKTVSLRALSKIADDAAILPASFGMKAAAMGAVALVLNKVINLENVATPVSRKKKVRRAVVA